MISKIQNIASQIIKLAAQKPVNSTLPLLLEILEKEAEGIYKIKIGNLMQRSKSDIPLQVGSKYFANLKQEPSGVLITNLIPFPKNFEFLETLVPAKNLQHLKSKDLVKNLQNTLLQDLANAQSKDEFIFIYHQLQSLQKGIFSFLIDDGRKNNLFQFRQKNGVLDFYALFLNLGEISGSVYKGGLNLIVQFENVAEFLKSDIKSLGFDRVEIGVARVSPLYSFSSNLLDLRI